MKRIVYNIVGAVGTTDDSRDWVATILQKGVQFRFVVVGICGPRDVVGAHEVLLIFGEGYPDPHSFTVVDGFACGYDGAGPADLSAALFLVQSLQIEIRSRYLEGDLYERIVAGVATHEDLVDAAEGREFGPTLDQLFKQSGLPTTDAGALWERWGRRLTPYSMIPREFWAARRWVDHLYPTDIRDVFADCEFLLREKISECGLEPDENATGVSLVGAAFGKTGCLAWPSVRPGSGLHNGRMHLLLAAFQTVRNPRTHRLEHQYTDDERLDDLIAYRAYAYVVQSVARSTRGPQSP